MSRCIWALLLLSAEFCTAGTVSAVYYFKRPVNDQNANIAGDDITAFQMTVNPVGTAFGVNAVIKDPAFHMLGGIGLVGNAARPDTTNGLNAPGLASDPQMEFNKDTLTKGALVNGNFPNGLKYTTRTDTFIVDWNTTKEVEFGPASALRFGFALDVDNRAFQKTTVALKDAAWTANAITYAAKGMNTIAAGKRNSYGFNYTNDLSTSILLYGLIFELRLDYLSSEQLDPYASLGGSPLPTPAVLIDGIPVPLASSYALNPGSNIDFDFPGDYENFEGYFTVQGQVNGAGSDLLAFAYMVEEVPEPSTLLLMTVSCCALLPRRRNGVPRVG